MPEILEGYQQTEIGVIPLQWEVNTLESISDKVMVGIASAATHAYSKQGIILFRNQNIKYGYLDDKDILYIREEYEEIFKNKRLKADDLIIARTGYPGATCVIPDKYEGTQSFTTLIVRPKKQNVRSDFLCYFLNSEVGQSFFESNQIGGGQKNVNAGSLKFMLIPLPPLPEQEAIAQALSDVDGAIAELDHLITKKRNIKQGAMQQLLTGKKRLPSFSGEWEVKKLEEVSCSIASGKSTSKSEIGKYPVYGSTGIIGNNNNFDYEGKKVLVARVGANAGVTNLVDGRYCVSDNTLIISLNQNVEIWFIYYKLISYA